MSDEKNGPRIRLEKLTDSECVISLTKNDSKIILIANKRVHNNFWTSTLSTVKENSHTNGAWGEDITQLTNLALVEFNIALSAKPGLIQHLEDYENDMNSMMQDDEDIKELPLARAPRIIGETLVKQTNELPQQMSRELK